ncbi:hypothetical protein HY003_01410 [Candidatus Saccharibacteria bacterium]|nr:hypothetical protein [Candidatus Saccharibacteria bacterium]MBI3337936.1 hypothetical protein [Candidatus Saccharibacteria bacterium]
MSPRLNRLELYWTCRKASPSPDQIISAGSSLSSLDVAMATSPSDKTVFARDNSLWERTSFRKSSRADLAWERAIIA